MVGCEGVIGNLYCRLIKFLDIGGIIYRIVFDLKNNSNDIDLEMSTVFPVADNEKMLGSSVLVAKHEDKLLFATVLHLFGSTEKLKVVIPPHEGECNKQQPYPINQALAFDAEILVTDPFRDLAIFSVKPPQISGNIKLPDIPKQPNQISVSTQIAVLGYPFAPMGSMLETWTPGHVTALAKRNISNSIGIDEIVISNQAHPGSSGSAIVGLHDGNLYGILRGSLSPPEVMRVGNIPIATDTSVTYGTSAHYLNSLIKDAINKF